MIIKEDEKIRFAGDISIDKIEIVSINGFGQEITNQVQALEIFEDIYSPFISGVVALQETLDYINLFPLVGEEFINIKLHTPSMPDGIDQQFAIYKLSNRLVGNDRNMVYELHFISKEALIDLNKKVSKSYQGNISDIVEQIVSDKLNGLESIKKFTYDQTINGIKYISNYWSPIKNINYLSDRAKDVNGNASYLFFENRDGLNFKSLHSMYTNPSIQTFVSDGYFRDFTADGKSIRNIFEEYRRIIDITVPVLFDYMDRAKAGMYASRKFTYDIVTKKYTVDNYDLFDENVNRLNEFPPISPEAIKNPSLAHTNIPKHYGLFNGYIDTTGSVSRQSRASLLKQAETTKVTITVPGRTDYTVGSKIFLDLNKFTSIKTSDEENDIQDKILSGYYIISSINHSINKEKHECVMEIIKDSYRIDLSKGR